MSDGYKNLFKQARGHPDYQKQYEECKARILLAEALYKARSEQDISMAKLAEKAGTTAAVISRIENAQVSPGIDIIYRIFVALGKKEITLKFA